MAFALPRRKFLASVAACVLAGRAPAAERRPVITMLGDSITAGYGLRAADALPAQVQAALARLGVQAEVRGAGVSGDTTAGGLARVDFSVQPDTQLCVVALGGNDLLQGLEPADARANLEGIVRRLRRRNIKVVLCGLRAPARVNARWAREFDAAFASAARETGATLYPDLLAGVEQNMALNQRDGIHPNPAGVKIIAARLAPVIARALRDRA
jgi:acyl-CoA thioesterase-1